MTFLDIPSLNMVKLGVRASPYEITGDANQPS